MYVNCPSVTKVVVNPTFEIEHVLRKIGYGRHPYLQERENGEREFVIDEPICHIFYKFHFNPY